MSVRELGGGSSSDGGVETIENIAETKGIDIDDIEVNHGETDDGDDVVTYRVYETKEDTEEDSIGFQVSRFPDSPMTQETFRNSVQNKMSSLKNYLSSGSGDSESGDETETDDTEVSDSETDRSPRRQTRSGGGEPEQELLDRRQELESRVADLEERVEELEQYTDALEGIQKLAGDSNDE